LTQEIHLSTLSSLKPTLVCGNEQGILLWPTGLASHYLSFQTATEKSTGGCVSRPNGDPLPFSLPIALHIGAADRSGRWEFQNLRANNHDSQSQAAGSPSGDENPEVQCPGLFTRPDNKYEERPADRISYGEMSHGIVRAIENM
jgi:hypothetical protein